MITIKSIHNICFENTFKLTESENFFILMGYILYQEYMNQVSVLNDLLF